MSNGFGFGFSFPNNGDDDGDNRNNQNPFGAFNFGGAGGGNLGDLLGQFGAMLSGMGTSMNNPENAGPINFEIARRTATQRLGTSTAPSAEEEKAVHDAVRLAELWLDDATSLPTAGTKVEAWDAARWLDETLPAWEELATPVAQHMNEAQLESMPEEARAMMGPMAQMMSQMNGMNHGMQLGNSLGELANCALSGADFELPVSPAGTIALVPAHIKNLSQELTVPAQEIMVYIAAKEAARQRLFSHVPWLVEQVISAVEAYAMGLVIDTSGMEELARNLNLQDGNIESFLSLNGEDFAPKISSRNAGAAQRLTTLLALIEGWVDTVVVQALGERIPSVPALSNAWNKRREELGSAHLALSKVVGIEIDAPQVAQAAELWRRVTLAVGADKRDSSWEHPDFLPTAEHIANPASFIDRLLDDASLDGFDEELAKLEQMLKDEDGSTEGPSEPEA